MLTVQEAKLFNKKRNIYFNHLTHEGTWEWERKKEISLVMYSWFLLQHDIFFSFWKPCKGEHVWVGICTRNRKKWRGKSTFFFFLHHSYILETSFHILNQKKKHFIMLNTSYIWENALISLFVNGQHSKFSFLLTLCTSHVDQNDWSSFTLRALIGVCFQMHFCFLHIKTFVLEVIASPWAKAGAFEYKGRDLSFYAPYV